MIPRRSPLVLLQRCETLLSHLANARRALSSSSPTIAQASPQSSPPINHALGCGVDFETDVIVIGAGVVGIAVARRAALAGASVVLLDRGSTFGSETSSRSSEVIHAGLYYPPGSLKATLCARGRDMLYAYCAEKGVPHRQIGKLVVATDGGSGGGSRRLEALASNADAACARAGAASLGLRLLSGAEARELEPALAPAVSRALFSPRTGIVDSHALMSALLRDTEAGSSGSGGGGGDGGGGGGGATTLALRSEAVPMPKGRRGSGSARKGGRLLTVAVRDVGAGEEGGGGGGGETVVFGARRVVNCAGLGAEACARGALAHMGPGVAASAPRVRYAKGSYFELASGWRSRGGSSGGGGGAEAEAAAAVAPPSSSSSSSSASSSSREPSPPFFSRLIYPLPEDGGLGIHLTLDLAGRARFGPDVEWLLPPAPEHQQQQRLQRQLPPSFDYRVHPGRAAEAGWHAAVRAYWPGLPSGPGALVPAYSGVRAKLSGPGEPAEDFGVQTAGGATWGQGAGARRREGGGDKGAGGHGVPGLVCLYGIESPGLTSSLALAEHVWRALSHGDLDS